MKWFRFDLTEPLEKRVILPFDGNTNQPSSKPSAHRRTSCPVSITLHKTQGRPSQPGGRAWQCFKGLQADGLSRDTFCRYQTAKDEGGVELLLDKNRRKPNLKNRIGPAMENAVVAFGTDDPAYGRTRASSEPRHLGIFVSPSGVRSIWLRHDLHNFKLRLRTLEKLSAKSGMVLTEAQVQSLKKRRTTTSLMEKLKRRIRGISAARIRSMSAPSRA